MEAIKNWGLMLLFVSAGSIIYCFLLPSGNISKTAKSVMSVVILSCICMPVFGVFTAFRGSDFSFSQPPEVSEPEDAVKKQAENAVNTVIREIIRKYTTVPYETEIFIDKTEDNSINIEYIGIIFSAKPQNEKEIREALYDAFSLMPDIRVEY